ncbi:DNA-directed RNA polymerase subunit alpha [Candidatus Daviesbacteria bacterium RIFCSPHIGHO2_01_FULL_40_11]|uniref:DNA-directed RNA polymerase subunit alpha n=1 Tax=Candidatus Daviesbacteria bacterium RIFCSPHIGHO2_01_FULL_40_11 TaxID=1797762 RepID=A0A1F5JKY8_9BACT|nr:MAG: DNA-directed RNA polymerase subunit alpha [Candidatus Daviesbacteria bacterium RIFCSPHIGHO2_01_FULL_40_11]OGE63015.1 MAG: DNA-directed RNA polymerase subunit alpha [Candidatus Daviesbacteria bacterium RIFCSPLOWO2_01_FULL_40_27]
MFKVKTEKESENFAKLAIEPLEVGFGHTLGNSLRRVLLTALPGAAVTSIKIDGISHRFSVLDGILEDVIEIILNIKKIRLNVHSANGIKLTLKASGKGIVKASDLVVEGDGEIVSPDTHIATLTDAKSKLNIEMIAQQGKGYSIAEERKTDEIGVISVDALFSPVVSVNYNVEPTRVGRRTDFDKLILDVTTDGTISPLEALNSAARILSDTFHSVFEPVVEEEVEDSGSKISEETLKLTIEELDLPVRITNALKAIEINIIEDLINTPRPQLLKAKNLGTKSIRLISEKLAERGLTLREA